MPVTSVQIASAAEALNRLPDLSPAARRVGLELLNHLDRRTGLAWPSEARLAEALRLNVRSIRRGKSELAERGLLTWVRRGTSCRGRTPIYALALDALMTLARNIKDRVKAATEAAKAKLCDALGTGAETTRPAMVESHKAAPSEPVGRTFSPTYLTQHLFKKSSRGGSWIAPRTPHGQILTDEQLDNRAHARIWEGLRQLGEAQMAAFISHPKAMALETEAIRAERFKPGSGLPTLARLMAVAG